MHNVKTIAIISAGYPTPSDPTKMPFVDQLVCAWADMGLSVCVICPITRFIELRDKSGFYKRVWKRKTEKGNEFFVFHPRYLGFGSLEEKIDLLYEMSYRNFQKAIMRILNSLSQKPDVLYSHFLSAGKHVGDLSKILGIPGYCAFGESTLWSVNSAHFDKTKQSLSGLKGIVSVSSENKKALINAGLYTEDRICVIPNAVNTELFYPHDKGEMRKKLGLPEASVMGIFVGAFSERKGVLRAQEAALKANIKMIYIGNGEEDPVGPNIIFKGKIPHAQIAEYLSAADFFVLPTRAEGCCNAIIEAIACGLPVISSNLGFNDDILEDEYSIRVNPDDIQQIESAMKFLTTDEEMRNRMSAAAKKKAHNYSIKERANTILTFMRE